MYYEWFHEVFPFYLSIGMTYEQFWEMDSSLVIAYRKAAEMKAKREMQERNYTSWLAGRYIYDALCCASPIFHDLARPGTKAHPYLERPYELETAKPTEDEKERKVRRGLVAMKNIAARFNKSYQEREARKLIDQPTEDTRK